MSTISNNTGLSSDTYNISNFITQVEKKFTGINEDTLYVGMYGYLNENLTLITQNSIVMAAEYANESIPAKAKFEKNIITHAYTLGFTELNAVPSTMVVLLGMPEKDILDNIGKYPSDIAGGTSPYPNSVVLDKDTSIFIGDIEFRLEYDLEIRATKLNDGSYTYSATYVFESSYRNPISVVETPYLQSPIKVNSDSGVILYLECSIRQYSENIIYKKILSDNDIENKIISFDFDSQLAAFDVLVISNGIKYYLTPVYENTTNNYALYCNYTYIDDNTIRVKFNSLSYVPKINNDIEIIVKTTLGVDGNFEYNEQIVTTLESDRCGYRNITCIIDPITNAQYGTNKKSIDELKRIIPREASSRGSITNVTDLENFFNVLNLGDTKLYFYKKRDNQIETVYFSYLLLKDSNNNVIPTNTINVKYVSTCNVSDPLIIFKTGSKFKMSDDGTYYEYTEDPISDTKIVDGKTVPNFGYMLPYTMIINRNPLYVSYYLFIFNIVKYFKFDYLNQDIPIQFISLKSTWKREFFTDRDTYKFDFDIMQSVQIDSLIEKDADGNIIYGSDGLPVTKIKIYALMYLDDGINAYAEAKMVKADLATYTFSYQFKFTTEDNIDTQNMIEISGVKNPGVRYDDPTTTSRYFNSNTPIELFILTKDIDPELNENKSQLSILVNTIPGLDTDNYNVTNKYSLENGIDFFYNFSNIISSIVNLSEIPEDPTLCNFHINTIPCLKHNYIEISNSMTDLEKSQGETRLKDFTNQLSQRKEYLEYSLQILWDPFGVDFKFFNTYGPSDVFKYIDGTNLSNVALTLNFRTSFISSSNLNLVENMKSDIKDYIEDISSINDLHIPNIITMITNTYREYIVFFEFMGMNGLGPGVQHVYNTVPDIQANITKIPEFLNISTDIYGDASIIIDLL